MLNNDLPVSFVLCLVKADLCDLQLRWVVSQVKQGYSSLPMCALGTCSLFQVVTAGSTVCPEGTFYTAVCPFTCNSFKLLATLTPSEAKC